MHITLLLVIAPSEAGKEGRRGERADVLSDSIKIKNKLKKKKKRMEKRSREKPEGKRDPLKSRRKVVEGEVEVLKDC